MSPSPLLVSVAVLLAAPWALAGPGVYDQDDALLGPVLGDLAAVRDNRVRPDDRLGADSQLLLVHVLFRHGDRTPDSPTYPTDPYANFSYAPVGWGALTPAGKRKEFRIGRLLRQRYGAFLGDYQPGVVSGLSTDWPRTKDSMALVLAGLFPPSVSDSWGEDGRDDEDLGSMWMPISFDVTPRPVDKVLYVLDAPCPEYDRLFKEITQSQAFRKQFHEDHARLINFLEKYSGAKMKEPADVYGIYQALLAQQGFNLTIPSWAQPVFPDKLLPLTAMYFELESYTRKMQRLRAGPLVKRILRHSVAKSRGLLRPANRKMYLYSAHDNNVAAFLRALKVWKTSVPPYGATVIVEVRSRAGHVGIELFQKNATTDEVYPMTMPDCEHFCPMHRFVQLISDVIPDDWDAECAEDRPQESTTARAA